MRRYDYYPAPAGAGYLLDLQTDLLDGLNTRVVAPLLPAAQAPLPTKLLNPVFEIAGASHVLVPQFLSAVPMKLLGAPAGNLGARSEEITRALDMLFHGF